MLKLGLYEQVISRQLNKQLLECEDKIIQTAVIDEAESSKILSKYVAPIIEKGLNYVLDNGGDIQKQIELINSIISTIIFETKEKDLESLSVAERAEQLWALLNKTDNILAINERIKLIRPETSIAQSSLFTGAINEPQMYTELKKEIVSCDKIDMLVSFIKWSGLRLIIEELRSFTQRGGQLRIITTSYMGATDLKAIEELGKLSNAQIKVSYDTKRTRLHAKSYVFHRESGFTTAYIGSSNLSNVAISSGLEWNIKVTQKDLPETLDKINATFESYWNSSEFEFYSENQKERLIHALKAEKYLNGSIERLYTFDISPYSYQQEILDRLDAERTIRGHYRNLIVAATGTGKTVISAFDYKRFRKMNEKSPCRLLFIAHREEILKQSLETFRGVLKDANFGEIFVGNYKPESIDNLFISIQMFNSKDFTSITSPEFYDYIIVDEFHHAAAPTYQKLLAFFKPKILLGLTATPERMDGKNILEYFENRIAAEIRLPEAIDRKLLCPFQYFGVTDIVDLDEIKWSRGGYDKTELTNIYTTNDGTAVRRADYIIASVLKYVTDIDAVKGLGFCVSVEHAKFMSNYFNEHNIPSIYLVGDSSDNDRKAAKKKLVSGEIRFIFVVDIYNEGVDIPEINTILFLRPTESLTIFLQQLGRGLRLSDGKECLTVLDFIGQANRKYNFEEKFAALLSNTTRGIQHEIRDGFISAPKGCYIQLERKAQKYILDNIRASLRSKSSLLTKIKTFEEESGEKLSLINFVNYYHLDYRMIYKNKTTFYSMCEDAGVWQLTDHIFIVPSKILFHFCYVDSIKWIDFILTELQCGKFKNMNSYSQEQQLMIKMLYSSIWEKTANTEGYASEVDALNYIFNDSYFVNELIEILLLCKERVNIVGRNNELNYDCPLEVYCTYTRDQALAALGFNEDYAVSEGVKYFKDKNSDVLFTTLNKTDKFYSPTTAYNDYSINEKLFHWQSQSTTSESSLTGQRYINHDKLNGSVLLFVREQKSDQYGAQAFIFLGKAHYMEHNGSKPMNIVWRLDNNIPAKFLSKTNKLILE